MPFSFGRDIFDEGEYAQVSCVISSGDLPVTITWSLQGVSVQGSDSGITTAPMGRRASFLSIQSVGSQHSGVYTCTARNAAGNSSFSTSLMVNGNFELGRIKEGEQVVTWKVLMEGFVFRTTENCSIQFWI